MDKAVNDRTRSLVWGGRMGLASGRRFGQYEILSRLGAGGRGEVYCARDTKLGRDVAIKILPDIFISARERLARFEARSKDARVAESSTHCSHLRRRTCG